MEIFFQVSVNIIMKLMFLVGIPRKIKINETVRSINIPNKMILAKQSIFILISR